MSRNLRARLDRLEQRHDVANNGALPRFWEALCSVVCPDDLPPETQQAIDRYRHPAPRLDPVEQILRHVPPPPARAIGEEVPCTTSVGQVELETVDEIVRRYSA
jgi:hypothetical protein